jgi:class 3 adenylate cyclase
MCSAWFLTFASCSLDSANFTAWSSSRSPEMVFMLLENVYSAFDKIADNMNVFKVETIGDCCTFMALCPASNLWL